jgi:hypothetical protein
MDSFQYIYNNGVQSKFIYFTVGPSYFQGAKPTYNVTGTDEQGNTYTAIMQRSLRGEFLIQNLQQTSGT